MLRPHFPTNPHLKLQSITQLERVTGGQQGIRKVLYVGYIEIMFPDSLLTTSKKRSFTVLCPWLYAQVEKDLYQNMTAEDLFTRLLHKRLPLPSHL